MRKILISIVVVLSIILLFQINGEDNVIVDKIDDLINGEETPIEEETEEDNKFKGDSSGGIVDGSNGSGIPNRPIKPEEPIDPEEPVVPSEIPTHISSLRVEGPKTIIEVDAGIFSIGLFGVEKLFINGTHEIKSFNINSRFGKYELIFESVDLIRTLVNNNLESVNKFIIQANNKKYELHTSSDFVIDSYSSIGKYDIKGRFKKGLNNKLILEPEVIEQSDTVVDMKVEDNDTISTLYTNQDIIGSQNLKATLKRKDGTVIQIKDLGYLTKDGVDGCLFKDSTWNKGVHVLGSKSRIGAWETTCHDVSGNVFEIIKNVNQDGQEYYEFYARSDRALPGKGVIYQPTDGSAYLAAGYESNKFELIKAPKEDYYYIKDLDAGGYFAFEGDTSVMIDESDLTNTQYKSYFRLVDPILPTSKLEVDKATFTIPDEQEYYIEYSFEKDGQTIIKNTETYKKAPLIEDDKGALFRYNYGYSDSMYEIADILLKDKFLLPVQGHILALLGDTYTSRHTDEITGKNFDYFQLEDGYDKLKVDKLYIKKAATILESLFKEEILVAKNTGKLEELLTEYRENKLPELLIFIMSYYEKNYSIDVESIGNKLKGKVYLSDIMMLKPELINPNISLKIMFDVFKDNLVTENKAITYLETRKTKKFINDYYGAELEPLHDSIHHMPSALITKFLKEIGNINTNEEINEWVASRNKMNIVDYGVTDDRPQGGKVFTDGYNNHLELLSEIYDDPVLGVFLFPLLLIPEEDGGDIWIGYKDNVKFFGNAYVQRADGTNKPFGQSTRGPFTETARYQNPDGTWLEEEEAMRLIMEKGIDIIISQRFLSDVAYNNYFKEGVNSENTYTLSGWLDNYGFTDGVNFGHDDKRDSIAKYIITAWQRYDLWAGWGVGWYTSLGNPILGKEFGYLQHEGGHVLDLGRNIYPENRERWRNNSPEEYSFVLDQAEGACSNTVGDADVLEEVYFTMIGYCEGVMPIKATRNPIEHSMYRRNVGYALAVKTVLVYEAMKQQPIDYIKEHVRIFRYGDSDHGYTGKYYKLDDQEANDFKYNWTYDDMAQKIVKISNPTGDERAGGWYHGANHGMPIGTPVSADGSGYQHSAILMNLIGYNYGFEGMMHYYSQEKGVATAHQDDKMREITGMDVPTYWAFVLNDVKAVIEDSFNTTGKFGNLTTTEWVDEIMEFIDRNRFRNITSNIYRSIGIANDDYRTFAKGRPFNYVRIYNPTGGIRQEFKDNLYYDEPYIPTTRKIEILEEEKIEEVPVIPNKEEELEEEQEEEKN